VESARTLIGKIMGEEVLCLRSRRKGGGRGLDKEEEETEGNVPGGPARKGKSSGGGSRGTVIFSPRRGKKTWIRSQEKKNIENGRRARTLNTTLRFKIGKEREPIASNFYREKVDRGKRGGKTSGEKGFLKKKNRGNKERWPKI